MGLAQKYLVLEGLKAGVAIKADAAFFDALPMVFSHWPHVVASECASGVFASLERKENRYHLSSPFMTKTEAYREPVNAICAIVAELAWARLREDPSLLCLHGAAAEFSGRLVVFPATRRAGKSTLSVAMAASSIRLFTDDFLPVSIGDDGVIRGISSGISPRLRLPLPTQIGEVATAYLARRQGVSNAQYRYVTPLKNESAKFGETAPLGGVVFLDRQEDADAEIREISKAEALKTLIYQNFSRAGNAGDILAMLEFVATNLPIYSLRYDETEPAVALLLATFSSWSAALPTYKTDTVLANEVEDGLKPFSRYKDISIGQFEQAEGVQVVSVDGKRFLTGRNGQSIHYLNEGAALIWQILSEPASTDEAIEILMAAFPEQTRTQIEGDVLRCFKDFGKNGLLHKLERSKSALRPIETSARMDAE